MHARGRRPATTAGSSAAWNSASTAPSSTRIPRAPYSFTRPAWRRAVTRHRRRLSTMRRHRCRTSTAAVPFTVLGAPMGASIVVSPATLNARERRQRHVEHAAQRGAIRQRHGDAHAQRQHRHHFHAGVRHVEHAATGQTGVNVTFTAAAGTTAATSTFAAAATGYTRRVDHRERAAASPPAREPTTRTPAPASTTTRSGERTRRPAAAAPLPTSRPACGSIASAPSPATAARQHRQHGPRADHLNEAVTQDAANGATPLVIQLVIYNLPGRDCAALARNGELGPNDLPRYKTEYIDVIAGILRRPEYANLRIVTIIEIDSLPNLVTNVTDRPTGTRAVRHRCWRIAAMSTASATRSRRSARFRMCTTTSMPATTAGSAGTRTSRRRST